MQTRCQSAELDRKKRQGLGLSRKRTMCSEGTQWQNCAELNHLRGFLEITGQQEVSGEILDRSVKIAKNQQPDQQTHHGETVAA